jgi:hypothetical protein
MATPNLERQNARVNGLGIRDGALRQTKRIVGEVQRAFRGDLCTGRGQRMQLENQSA